MSDNGKRGFLNDELSKRTSIFGLRLWVVLGIGVGAAIVLVLFLLSLLCFTSRRNLRKIKNAQKTTSIVTNKPTIPNVSKEITEIRPENLRAEQKAAAPHPVPDSTPVKGSEQRLAVRHQNDDVPFGQQQRIHIEIGKDHRISYPEPVTGLSSHESGEQMSMALVAPEVSHLGWGHWFTLRELEEATNGFADENVIGEGGYGIVYRGVLDDSAQVAVKNLLNNRSIVHLCCMR